MFNLIIGRQHSSVSLVFSFYILYFSSISRLYTSPYSRCFLTPSVKNSLPTAFNFSFLFWRTQRKPSWLWVEPSREPTISLVTRSFLRARQVIFHHLHFFFVHCAEIAGVLALPQLIFRRVEARLSIGRGRRPFPRRDHPSSETESLLQRNTIPVR